MMRTRNVSTMERLLTLLLLFPAWSLFAQTGIQAGEYFYDSDPGVGLGVALDPEDLAFGSAFEIASDVSSSLGLGKHTLFIRFLNEAGVWGPTFRTIIEVENNMPVPEVNLNLARAWWDNDLGAAVNIPVIDGNFDESFEQFFATDFSIPLSTGLHTLNVQIMDNDSNWGPEFRTVLNIEELLTAPDVQINMARYWWNNDQGNAVNMLAFDGDYNEAFEQIIANGLITPAIGTHVLHVQSQDYNGNWGPDFSTVISVEDVLTVEDIYLNMARYWWNNDQGNAVNMIAFDGDYNEAFEQIIANGLITPAIGTHVLHVQSQDHNGNWGPDFSTVISVEDVLTAEDIHFSNARYWWNNDQGNAINMIAFDGDYNEAFEQAISTTINTPETGTHVLHVQAQDHNGNWGPDFKTILEVEALLEADNVRISSARYWWNADIGNAQTLFAFDGNYDESMEQLLYSGISAPSEGTHVLHVQIQDFLGNWGTDFKTIVTAEEPLIADNIRISLLEYWIDNDPGQGAGSAILAFDAVYNESFELSNLQLNTALLDTGLHILGVRALSYNGNWGPDFLSVIYVDPCQSSPLVEISPAGPSTICPGDSLLLNATAGLSDYRWYRGLDLVGTGESTYIYESGVYRVVAYDVNGCPGTSAFYTVNPAAAGTITVTNLSSLNFCDGGSVTLVASNGYTSYEWSNGQSGQAIAVDVSGDYSVIGTTGAGCNALSDTLTVQVFDNPALPVITITGSPAFCLGDSVLLHSSYPNNNFWNTGDTNDSIYAYLSGAYAVTYFDMNGCFSTSEPISITVANTQVVFLTDANVLFLPNSTVQFSSLAIGDIATYSWGFGDGNTSTDQNPSHTYAAYGLYDVSLEVTDVGGCTASFDYPASLEVWQVYPTDDLGIPGVTDSITSISFLSPYVGCVTTAGGEIWGTTDGGLTWTLIPTGANIPWYTITLTGNGYGNEAWIAGGNGTICYSNNGGVTWNPTPTGTNETFYDLWFNGPGNGWAAGSGGIVCWYGNGGWNDISPGLPGTTFYSVWYGGGILWAAGSGGILCYYYGGVWYPVYTGSGANWYGGGYYPGSNCIWLVGSGGTIYFSPDGGTTWNNQSPGGGYDYDLNDIIIIDGQHAICVGNHGVILVTYDGGNTWEPWSSGTTEDLLSCELIDCVVHITSASGTVYQINLGLQPVAPEISADGPLTVCSADTLILSVDNPRVGYTYTWSDGTVGYTTIADQPTDYWVVESGYCGEANSDTLQVVVNFATLWYADTDEDGYGDLNNELATCDLPPPGYVSNSDDCDDSDPLRTTYCPPPCFGDFNDDQVVNAADLLILLSAISPAYCGENCTADANGDGYVSTADLLLFLAYYGTPCPQ